MSDPEYIGGGIRASHDYGMIWLRNGDQSIALAPWVYDNLVRFAAKALKAPNVTEIVFTDTRGATDDAQ